MADQCEREGACGCRCPFARLMASKWSAPVFMGFLVACSGIYFLPGTAALVSTVLSLILAVALMVIMLRTPRRGQPA